MSLSVLDTKKVTYKVEDDEENYECEVEVYEYSSLSVAIKSCEHFGKSFAENLKSTGGKYNKNLKFGPGWIFSKSKKEAINNLLDEINQGKIIGSKPVIYSKTKVPKIEAGDNFGSIMSEPFPIVCFNKMMEALSSVKEGKIIYSKDSKMYIWGIKKDVEDCLKSMDKIPMMEFSTPTHYFVVTI